MVKEIYIPDQGDIVYFNFSPSKGREQKGIRPGIILSRIFLNRPSGLAIICPITSKKKFYPFEVSITTKEIFGVALVDQGRSVDYEAREIRFVSKASIETIQEIKEKFITLVK